MRRSVTIPTFWQARLAAWPGVLTLLSVLVVALGLPVQVQDTGPRLSVSPVAPAMPEMRPAPQPSPAQPLPPAPPPQPLRLPTAPQPEALGCWAWAQPSFAPDLAVMGRQQTDGG